MFRTGIVHLTIIRMEDSMDFIHHIHMAAMAGKNSSPATYDSYYIVILVLFFSYHGGIYG